MGRTSQFVTTKRPEQALARARKEYPEAFEVKRQQNLKKV
jgi:hypothetical protein